jgi:hypothetical protein
MYGASIGEPPYTPATFVCSAREVENDAWSESTLTWNIAQANHPPVGSLIDTQTIDGTPDKWYSWDVTSYVRSEVAGDKIVSICLMSENEGTVDAMTWFRGKDTYEGQPRPYLEVSWRAPTVPPVGGTVRPVDKLALLAPWIVLAALIVIASASVAVYLNRRCRKPT